METHPLFEIGTRGRQGPARRDRLSPAELAWVRRTATRAPEVIVKASGSASTARKAAAYFAYISRSGDVAVETQDGNRLTGDGAAKAIVDEWQLEIDQLTITAPYAGTCGRRPHQVTRHLVLSMPVDTPPEGLWDAAKAFAREEFALQHDYALALHTDQAHPHVHLVVRAQGINGRRLRIDKQTLRHWRELFAGELQRRGIAANATPARVRGRLSAARRDRRYRVERRGEALMPRNAAERHRTADVAQARAVSAWRDIEAQLRLQNEDPLADLVARYSRDIEGRHSVRYRAQAEELTR